MTHCSTGIFTVQHSQQQLTNSCRTASFDFKFQSESRCNKVSKACVLFHPARIAISVQGPRLGRGRYLSLSLGACCVGLVCFDSKRSSTHRTPEALCKGLLTHCQGPLPVSDIDSHLAFHRRQRPQPPWRRYEADERASGLRCPALDPVAHECLTARSNSSRDFAGSCRLPKAVHDTPPHHHLYGWSSSCLDQQVRARHD